MSKELVKIITLDTAILAGFALLVVFPGFFVTAFMLALVGGFFYVISRTMMTEEDWRRFLERLAIGYVVGRISRGKDIL